MAQLCCPPSPPHLHQGKALYLAATILMEEEIPFPAWPCGSLHRPEEQMLNMPQAPSLTSNYTTPSPYFFSLPTEAQTCWNPGAAGLELGAHSTQDPCGDVTPMRFLTPHPSLT